MDPLIPQGTAPAPVGTEQAPPQEEQVADAGQNEEGDETDPEWDKAELLLKKVLFEGDGLKGIVKSIMETQQNPADAMAQNTLSLMKAIDERTQGQIPEDYLMPLATMAMAYIAEGVEAAGQDVPSMALAEAMKKMLFQHLTEFGSDAQAVQAQLDKVNMEELASAMDAARSEADNGEEAEPSEEPEEEPEMEDGEEEVPPKRKPLIGG
jgi:hypothetical protein